MSSKGMGQYLADFGILACNENPWLPSLDMLGFTWADAVALIDRQEVFVSKAWRRRTVYLSPEVYFLLKECREHRPMTTDAIALYDILLSAPMESADLKRLVPLQKRAFDKTLEFLMEECYVTALRNGTWKTSNWSSYVYGAAETWEALAHRPAPNADSWAALTAILGRTMPEREVAKLLGVHRMTQSQERT
ncbi:hypothetical protein KL86CLO1_11743 [uncultured Eubacteriales bacterium]|uniref:Uncharacterized protein n=1 Tax=uncultured Eubacteriales bacterium TaxID=172733 RepID=A0A212JV55_9FIRM|nr:hypothetical protein KL86CLO1_11743 [uncultured Eubacteriales bacterium]